MSAERLSLTRLTAMLFPKADFEGFVARTSA